MGEIVNTKGATISVKVKGEEKDYKKEVIQQVNPPKLERCEDMSDLTYLNEASVLWNLKSRYYLNLIYTYSGLFCVAVNPYRRFPIYTDRVVQMYKGKQRKGMPPHIFAVSDGAYNDMLNNRENQSMLITGESGAGKTENTKKVITYFAIVGAAARLDLPVAAILGMDKQEPVRGGKANLEDQVIQTNPVLEAFGNAKTVRNDNSSRFGKFIRIHFGAKGKLAGADIETYLLEKARVISQQKGERSYHIFYQMMSGAMERVTKDAKLTDDWSVFAWQSMGVTSIEGVDDAQGLDDTDLALNILGFSEKEKTNIYRVVGAVMHFSTMKFKQRGREEQAEADGTAEGCTIASLMGIDAGDLYFNLLKPQIKVGNEVVTQCRNKMQIQYSIGSLAKAVYDRLFKWLVRRCNSTLDTPDKRSYFIGVLDIAGFEIFQFNGFEQLCINYTNEKLQQYFNHNMFILEQEEYEREGIPWTFIDFGLDLQACIDLIEKPLGIFSILEEESMFPKATDKTFEDKLNNNHIGKSPHFLKPKLAPPKKVEKGKEPDQKPEAPLAHFSLVHYAGVVSYNLSGWLEKNKDPLNDTVVEQCKKSTNPIVHALFEDHPGITADAGAKVQKRKKGANFQTVSYLYKEQVGTLLATLRCTAPHFIRCIIPNEHKQAGLIDSVLVMQQLTCNGVLEGIRICRKGFPNRMMYSDFRHRYIVLAPLKMKEQEDDKIAAKECMEYIAMEEDKFRLGHSKIFFRSGVVGYLEDLRDAKIQDIMTWLQSSSRGYLGRIQHCRMILQKEALPVVQNSIKNYLIIRDWLWWKLWQRVKPLLKMSKIEDHIKELEDKIEEQETQIKIEKSKEEQQEKELEEHIKEKAKMEVQMEELKVELQDLVHQDGQLIRELRNKDGLIEETQRRLVEEEEAHSSLSNQKKKIDQEVHDLKKEMEDLELSLAKAAQDKTSKDHQIRTLNSEIQQQDDMIAKINKEKKMMQDQLNRGGEELQVAEDRNNHLTKVKAKLEQTLDELEDALEKEKRDRGELDKYRRKVEGDLKLSQETISDMERGRKELQQGLLRKDKELASLTGKLEDEQALVARGQKQVKELGLRLEELEEEAETERLGRAKAEKQKAELARELEELAERLDEAGGATSAQVELNRKREMEMARMRKELEEGHIVQEAQLASLKKRQGEALTEMADQLDCQSKLRQKIEKEKHQLVRDNNELTKVVDRLNNEKAIDEKNYKLSQSLLQETQFRLDEAARQNSDLDHSKKKLLGENSDLNRQLEENESQLSKANKMRVSLQTQLEDMKKLADEEGRERSSLSGKYKNVQHDNETLKEQLEEEVEARSDVQRQLSKANGDAALWRAKYETEAVIKVDEIEGHKMKLQARLGEAEENMEGLNNRCIYLEKLKHKLMTEIEDMQIQVDHANSLVNTMEKKSRNFDKIIGEWKMKVEDLTMQLEEAKKDSRNYSAELFRLKASHEDLQNQSDTWKRENKNLSDEIKDLLDQIGEGGRSLHDIQKAKRRLETEKDELSSALEEAEAALEQEENKTLKAHLELSQIKQEIDRRLLDKEEEFESTRKTYQRTIESVQASLEAESNGKAEAQRMKKKLESDILELELALDHTNRNGTELASNVRKWQGRAAELQQLLEEEQRAREDTRDALGQVERKANSLSNDVEEARTLLEQSERGRRNADNELHEAKERIHELEAEVTSIGNVKRKLEVDFNSLSVEMEEQQNQSRHADDKCKKAVLEECRLAEELRMEQDRASREEAARREAETQLKETIMRVEEAEAAAAKGGKKLLEKLETRIRSLEYELDLEQRKYNEVHKNMRRAERKCKEMEYSQQQEVKNFERLQVSKQVPSTKRWAQVYF